MLASFAVAALLATASSPDPIAASDPRPEAAPAAAESQDVGALDAPVPPIRLERVFGGEKWVRPTQILAVPGDPDRLLVLEQGGRMKSVRRSAADAAATLFMDIRDRVSFTTNEEGLLSVAFHPGFESNRLFFAYYSASTPRRSVLSRFRAVAGPDGTLVGDPASEETILEVEQPYWNHNGGTVLFGPDGMLYLSLGDGGAAGDPLNAGQDLSTLLAKVIRIDVDRREGERRYAVPADNPFVGRAGARPEIWALGLRNVWRMHFDRATGLLWAGDVGQNAWEEIDVIVRGGNYGWKLREGRHPFARGGEGPSDLIDPVIEYPHRDGLSVTGGFVYRGSAIEGLQGAYLYADYAYGTIWAARTRGERVGPSQVVHRGRGLMISSFGEDADGELWLCAFEGGERGPGVVMRLVPGRGG